jgi:hypothetical protein
MPEKYTTTVEVSPRHIADQIVTAIEGGVGYWLEKFEPVKGHERATTEPWYDDEKVWSDDFLVKCSVIEEEKTFEFTPQSIRDGLQWLAANRAHRIEQILQETGDADTADVFLQACLFKDIVYG